MPNPVRTVRCEVGDQAMPTRGAKPHWRAFMSVSLAPGVASFGLFPAISSPEFKIVSVAELYEYKLGLNAVSFPYFSESGPSKSQRRPSVTVRLLRTL